MLVAAFPEGVTLKTNLDHERFALYCLILVKLSRYSVQWETGHHDSIHDCAVYAAMLEAVDGTAGEHGQRGNQRHNSPAPKTHWKKIVARILGKD
jgi:hypothetical protein